MNKETEKETIVPKQEMAEVKRGPGGKWQKGQSGNPKGGSEKLRNRPKLTPMLMEILEEMREVKLASGKSELRETAKLVLRKLVAGALAGDIHHIKEVLERWDGKVPTKIIGDDRNPLVIESIGKYNDLSNEEIEKAIIALREDIEGSGDGAAEADAGGPEVHSVRPKNKPLVQGKLASPRGGRKAAKGGRRKA